ncbi:Crp/Fnr family transcriptional regulator (plasmid) [Photobacterium sp. DA100]|nr:Crp/Fnr family transcriptional regulator [Photobacterium sp. DA100]WEM45913.1 Crp/Fnr family transcriptional regulator [Photobacterium sp. DA100]
MVMSEILSKGPERFRQLIANESFRRITRHKGDYIVRQEHDITEVYWSAAAQFMLLHTALNGKTLSLGDYYLEDNFFGEIEFFSGKPCSFDVVATATTELVVIPKERFAEILLEDASISFWMNHRMANMYQSSMNIAIERSLYPLKFNIVKDIVSRCTSETRSLNHDYMYQEAQRFGCTDRAYTRIIHELIKEGLVKKGKDKSTIVPVNLDGLIDYLNQSQQ